MDGSDTIAPVDPSGGNQMADYRRYLEANTGDRLYGSPGSGAPEGSAPQIAPVAPQPPPGAGPQVGAAPPGAQPQQAMIAPPPPGAGSDTPALDMIAPNPVNPPPQVTPGANPYQAPQAPQADQAPMAQKMTKRKGVKQADQAPQAPNIDDKPPANGPDLGDESSMTPASGHVVKGKKTADGRPLIAVQPDGHDPDNFWDKDKLQDAHTAQDLVAAIKPGQLPPYMDWWEQQHGDINQRYDQMRQDLGARPDPNREPTRKEKFTELMNFGLSLMQHAQRGTDQVAAVGGAMQGALQTQKDKQLAQTQDYDARTAGIENQRQNQLKDIGNYGQAMREDALIQNEKTRTNIEAMKALTPPKTGQPTTRILNDGTQVDYDPKSGTWNPSVDKNGKPLGKMPLQGPRGGMSHTPDRMAEFNDLVKNQGVDPNRALGYVYGSGGIKNADPLKTYNAIYAKARGLYESPEDAAKEAEEMTTNLHGANWRSQAGTSRTPAIAPKPPAQPPPPGKIGTDAQGNKWRNENGKAVLVQ